MRTRVIAVLVASVCVATTLVATSSPASADVGGSKGGSNGGDRFSAWAYYARATGGGEVSMPQPCTLALAPDVPAHYEYIVSTHDGGATYTVFYECVADDEAWAEFERLYPDLPTYVLWQLLGTTIVTPADPQQMVNEAIALLDPAPPAISIDHDPDAGGMVGFPVLLSFTEPLDRVGPLEVSDGPIRVEVWADPVGEVVWDTGDTGDGRPACNAPAVPAGECAHTYDRSSIDGGAEHEGQPAYSITAQISYRGGYAVYANGSYIGGSNDIGDLQRTAETVLAVNDGQGINTRG